MRLLFVIDPLAALNPKKDSTVALMRAATRRGDNVYCATLGDLSLIDGAVRVNARRLSVSEDDARWMQPEEPVMCGGEDFDMVWMRKEPPVDEDFMMATRLLDILAMKTPVLNAPRALREWNEKLSIFRFPEWIMPTWVGADASAAADFHRQHGEVVLKPLNGMGGQGVYVAPAGDMNFRSVFAMLSEEGRRLVMVQAYSAVARDGDFRVFVVGGKPFPSMLARLPRADDHRGNLAAGGRGEVRPLSDGARRVAEALGDALMRAGIVFAGLDIIGDKLIEINITCPTGLREVRDQSGEDVAELVLQCADDERTHWADARH